MKPNVAWPAFRELCPVPSPSFDPILPAPEGQAAGQLHFLSALLLLFLPSQVQTLIKGLYAHLHFTDCFQDTLALVLNSVCQILLTSQWDCNSWPEQWPLKDSVSCIPAPHCIGHSSAKWPLKPACLDSDAGSIPTSCVISSKLLSLSVLISSTVKWVNNSTSYSCEDNAFVNDVKWTGQN